MKCFNCPNVAHFQLIGVNKITNVKKTFHVCQACFISIRNEEKPIMEQIENEM